MSVNLKLPSCRKQQWNGKEQTLVVCRDGRFTNRDRGRLMGVKQELIQEFPSSKKIIPKNNLEVHRVMKWSFIHCVSKLCISGNYKYLLK